VKVHIFCGGHFDDCGVAIAKGQTPFGLPADMVNSAGDDRIAGAEAES
jgi:hypothetical protein